MGLTLLTVIKRLTFQITTIQKESSKAINSGQWNSQQVHLTMQPRSTIFTVEFRSKLYEPSAFSISFKELKNSPNNNFKIVARTWINVIDLKIFNRYKYNRNNIFKQIDIECESNDLKRGTIYALNHRLC